MSDYLKTYDIAGGDITIIQRNLPIKDEKVSLQVDCDAAFNGTTATVELVQSNDRDTPLSNWHPLPEAPLTLLTSDSSLLSTFAFTAKYIAVKVVAGDATAGILTFTENFKD